MADDFIGYLSPMKTAKITKKPHVLSDLIVHRDPMKESPVPVILVLGWNSHPMVWNRLLPRLNAAGIPFIRFSHVEMEDRSLPKGIPLVNHILSHWSRGVA